MGRPIQKKWFGNVPGAINVAGAILADGTIITDGYIVKQTGSAAYVVQDAAMTFAPEICFMVNADSIGALLPGQCYIEATPFGGTALPCETIAQYKVSVYTVANTIPRETGDPAVYPCVDYTWSTMPAVAGGQADLDFKP
jgi:hypothetical protein